MRHAPWIIVPALLLAFSIAEARKAAPPKAVIKEINITEWKPKQVEAGFNKPIEIANIEDFAKVFPGDDAKKAIAKEIDFAKHKLVYFAWSGSGQDKLTFVVEADKKEVVVFNFKAGLTRDFRPHNHLFALGKDTAFKIAK